MINFEKRINIFCGNYGSGKTEIALNSVLYISEKYNKLAIVDLDIVNPYFRSREEKTILNEKGIKVISSNPGFEMTDLPAISPAVSGVFQDKTYNVVLDVGGDDVGATVLGRFNNLLKNADYELFIVINCNRPFTDNVQGIIKIIREIESSSRLKATAIINNTNLGKESSVEDLYKGRKIIKQVEKHLKIPLKFHCIEKKLYHPEIQGDFDEPIFPIKRFMLPPWEKF